MKNRVLFLFSKGVSHIGTRLFTFALSWYILSESGSGMGFSLSLLVNYLPQILLSLLAGHISGKARRPNRLLVLCDAASAVVCCLPLFHLSLISIYVTIFLLSAISAFFNNVIDTHLVHLEGVDSPKSLKRLTSAVQFITSGANIIAPSLGGLLIQVLPVQMFAVLNMASFLLSAFGELWLKYRPRQAGRPSQDKADSRAVLAYMFGSGKLRTFFLADSLGNFFVTAGINVALPLIVTTALGISSGGYGAISSSTAAGSVLCAVWRTKSPGTSRLQYPFRKMGFLGGCMLLLSLSACLTGHQSWSVIALCAIMFAVGWLSVDINIQTKTTLQLFVEPVLLGRVLGISTAISYVLIPLSLVLAGGLSEIWPAFVLPLASGGMLMMALVVLWGVERKDRNNQKKHVRISNQETPH